MPSINTPDSYFDRDLCYEYCKCSKSPIRSVIGHSKSRKTKLELGLSIKVSKAKMMNLSNSKKSDKPIGSMVSQQKRSTSVPTKLETRICPLEKTYEGLDPNIVPAAQPKLVG